MIVTLIPAAGASSRMRGKDKLLETIRGEAILRHVAMTAIEADLGPVIVTLPPKAKGREKALRNLDLTRLEITDPSEGMSASLRVGGDAAHRHLIEHEDGDYEYSGLLVMLPDMPEITSQDLKDIALNFSMSGGMPQRAATQYGTPGHPVLFPDHSLPAFADLCGDAGARAILADHAPVLKVPLAGNRATTDLDTPEEWAAWRKATNTPN